MGEPIDIGPCALSALLRDDAALDDGALAARYGTSFLLVEVELAASPFDFDGTLPELPVAQAMATAAPRAVSATVYALRRRIGTANRPLTIGRTKATDVVIDDKTVSKLHAFFATQDDGTLRLTDAGSTNGTFVDGVRLRAPPAGQEHVVAPGDVVRFGTVKGRYLDLAALRVWLGTHPERPRVVEEAPRPPPVRRFARDVADARGDGDG